MRLADLFTRNHGRTLAAPLLPKWTFVSLLFWLHTGIKLAAGVTCYGAAQLSCYNNMTLLVELINGGDAPGQNMDTCSAFYALRDCLAPHVAFCDMPERQLLISDIQYLTSPPYNCRNDSIKVLEQAPRHNSGHSPVQHPQAINMCTVTLIVSAVINLFTWKPER